MLLGVDASIKPKVLQELYACGGSEQRLRMKDSQDRQPRLSA